uniref:response regulator n=1 Tax=Hydrogenophaga sp. OTU3427 TaxID=3043856 RepID=UPI00313EF485
PPPPPPRRGAPPGPPEAPARAPVPMQGRVLLVEDQPVNQKLAMAVLARIGLSAVLATNGQEALACLREQTFDLVLMDCQMPVMDGYEATARLRAGEAGEAARGVTVLALTANVMPEDVVRCEAAGFSGHVAKPFTVDILREALLPWLAQSSVA